MEEISEGRKEELRRLSMGLKPKYRKGAWKENYVQLSPADKKLAANRKRYRDVYAPKIKKGNVYHPELMKVPYKSLTKKSGKV